MESIWQISQDTSYYIFLLTSDCAPHQALPPYSFCTRVIKSIGKMVQLKIGATSYHKQNIIGTEFIYTTAACFH